MVSLHIRHIAISMLFVFIISICEHGFMHETPTLDSYDMDMFMVSQDGVREPKSCLKDAPSLTKMQPKPSGKRLPTRIDEVLLDLGATRAALKTMLSDWGESTIRVDDTLVQHVSYFLKCFALCERLGTGETLERSKRYLPQIKQVFAKHGLPEDLAFAVPFVESRFTETARSRAGALGMFQFLAATAEDYGVAANQRLDWKRTCVAAAKFLSGHQKMFDSVLLALGAYHHGATTVSKVLAAISRKGKEKSFHSLFACNQLEAYSREYIPLCLAAACLHRLLPESAATRMPNLRAQYVSIQKSTPLDKLSARHGNVTANNPDLVLADKLYRYASTGGYLLITDLNGSGKHADSRPRPLRIAQQTP